MDNLEIEPIAKDKIGFVAAVMDDDAMYIFVGLTAEDDKAEEARHVADF